jgi:sulfonate transport system substrate-binding protein
MNFSQIKSGLIAFVLAAFASGAAHAQQPVKIRIGWIISPHELSSIMFLKEGLARHNGKSYIAETIRFRGSTEQLPAAQSGNLDIIALGSSSLPVAIQNAGIEDLRIIADETRIMPGWAATDYRVLKDSPIKTIEDLKGKILATNVIGGLSHVTVKALLAKHGMVVNRDYTEIEIGMALMSAALLQKRADVVNSTRPFDVDPNFLAQSRVLFTSVDVTGPFETSMWTAKSSFINTNRAALTDLLEDYVRAHHWFWDPKNHDEAVRIVSNLTKIPPEQLDSWLFVPYKMPYQDINGRPDLDIVTANIKMLNEIGYAKSTLDAHKYADLSPLEAAIARVK